MQTPHPTSTLVEAKTPLSLHSTEMMTSSPSSEADNEKGSQSQNGSPQLEGGIHGWLSVVGGALVGFCTFGLVQSYGVFQDHYTRISLNEYSASEISWIGSTQTFLLFAVGTPATRLLDKGYFHWIMPIGTIIYTASMLLLSLCKPQQYYQHMLSQGVGMGIGMGLMFVPCFTISSHYFRRRRSLAMGCVVAGSGVGACLLPMMLNNLIGRSNIGFGWAVRSVALLNFGLLFIANLISKPRIGPQASGSGNPPPVTLKGILADLPFAGFLCGTFLLYLGVFVPFFYLQLYATLRSVDPGFVKYAITVMNVASIFGRVIPNIAADVFGPFNVLVVCSALSGALVFALYGASDVGGIAAFGIVYGFFSGGVASLTTPASTSFTTHEDHSDIGMRIGVLSSVLAFASLAGSPIAGALLTSERHWERPLAFSAVTLFSGAGCYILVWRSASRRRGSKRL